VTTVAYLTGEYPRATDTFIQREIAAVEACGVDVERFGVRRPGEEHMVGERQRSERERTTYLLESSPTEFASLLLSAACRSPLRFWRAALLAVRTRRLGRRGAARQVAYFVEAVRLAALMADRGVDHLHNHFADSSCTVAMLASELSGIPYSFTIHGPSIFFEPTEWCLGTKVERAAFCAAISNFARSQTSLFTAPSAWPRIRIVHCGVDDPGEISPAERTDELCRLLFVGRLDQVKGVVVLFGAVASMIAKGSPVSLTLVGDGPQRAELEARVRSMGIADSVHFAGYCSQEEVQQQLAASDVFVLPSFAEGVPVSLMEAMARSLPVVATNVGGVTELVQDGVNGLVVAPGDADALEAALDRLVTDADLRHRFGRAGHDAVRSDFDSMTEARRLVTLFLDPAAPGPSRPAPIPLG